VTVCVEIVLRYVRYSCFIWVHYAVIFIVLRLAEIVHFVTGNLPS